MSPVTTPTSLTFSDSFHETQKRTPSISSKQSTRSSASTSQGRRSPTAMFSALDFPPPRKPKPLPTIRRTKTSHSQTSSQSPNAQPPPLFSSPKIPRGRSSTDASKHKHSPSNEPLLKRNIAPLRVEANLERLNHPSSSDTSPGGTPTTDAHKRSQKMEKLTRTLGETVPAELVFPALSTEVMMEFVTPASPAIAAASALANIQKERETVKEKKFPRRASVAVSSFSPISSLATALRASQSSRREETSQPRSGTGFVSGVLGKARSRSGSEDKGHQIPRIDSFPSTSGARLHSNTRDNEPSQAQLPSTTKHEQHTATIRSTNARERPESLYGHKFEDAGSGSHVGRGQGKEKEQGQVNEGQGWSGEWNRSDMQDVINKLRKLK